MWPAGCCAVVKPAQALPSLLHAASQAGQPERRAALRRVRGPGMEMEMEVLSKIKSEEEVQDSQNLNN